MTLQEVKLLLAYNAWANNRVFAAVETVSGEDYARDLKTGHGSIHGTLTHMVAAEKIWLSRMAGSPDKAMVAPSEVPAFADVKALWEKTGFDMAKFLGGLSDRKLQDTFTMTVASGRTYTHQFWQGFQHVVDHSSYHRGQIAVLMRQLGYTPAAMGLMAFHRETAKLT
jgi:uncharacterized damage-inducible protein DinB